MNDSSINNEVENERSVSVTAISSSDLLLFILHLIRSLWCYYYFFFYKIQREENSVKKNVMKCDEECHFEYKFLISWHDFGLL